MTLPPLNTPDTHCFDDESGEDCWSYSEQQMREYGQQCRETALEEAAKLCNGEQWWMKSSSKTIDYITAFNEGCANCEAAIRRLK